MGLGSPIGLVEVKLWRCLNGNRCDGYRLIGYYWRIGDQRHVCNDWLRLGSQRLRLNYNLLLIRHHNILLG